MLARPARSVALSLSLGSIGTLGTLGTLGTMPACSSTAPSPAHPGVSADNLVVASTDISEVTSVFSDHLEIPQAGHEALLTELAPGKIISGAPSSTGAQTNPSGYLRIVTEAHGDGTTIFVTTTSAALTDAIVSGTLGSVGLSTDTTGFSSATSSTRLQNTGGSSGTPTPAGSSDDGGGGASSDESTSLGQTLSKDFYGDVVLLQSESGEISSHMFNLSESVKVAEGTVSFTPTFEHQVDIENHSLNSLRMKVGGDFKLHAVLDVVVTADVDLEYDGWHGAPTKKLTQLAKLPRIKLPVQFVGALPVYESLDLGLDFGCDFTFQGPIETKVGIDVDLSAAVGAAYANGQWSNIGQSPQIQVSPIFQMTTNGSLSLQCYVQPTAQLLFYDVAGPNVAFGPYAELDAQLAQNTPVKYALYPGFNAAIGGDFQLFGRDVAFGQFTIWQCQSPKPLLASSTLPDADSDNAGSGACSFLPDMTSGTANSGK